MIIPKPNGNGIQPLGIQIRNFIVESSDFLCSFTNNEIAWVQPLPSFLGIRGRWLTVLHSINPQEEPVWMSKTGRQPAEQPIP